MTGPTSNSAAPLPEGHAIGATDMRIHGQFGVRSWALADSDVPPAVDAAIQLEEMGFGALWLRAGVVPLRARILLENTTSLTLATSVNSIWADSAGQLAAEVAMLAKFGNRFLLGLGVSHAPMVERSGRVFEHPLEQTRAYLDLLDLALVPVRKHQRILAAQGPEMVRLGAERCGGVHPYLVTTDHTAFTRTLMGPDPVLAPAVPVIVGTDVASAREAGRLHLSRPYLTLANYARSFLRQGFTEDDLAGGGSDRLVDAIVIHGDAGFVAKRLREHLHAGADHVSVHLLTRRSDPFALDTWRALAEALKG